MSSRHTNVPEKKRLLTFSASSIATQTVLIRKHQLGSTQIHPQGKNCWVTVFIVPDLVQKNSAIRAQLLTCSPLLLSSLYFLSCTISFFLYVLGSSCSLPLPFSFTPFPPTPQILTVCCTSLFSPLRRECRPLL